MRARNCALSDPARRQRYSRRNDRFVPSARVGHIGIYREPRTLQAVEYYLKLPEDLAERDVILVDPMLATGNSAVAAISRLVELKARSIKFVCLVAAPEGVETVSAFFPRSTIVAAALDRCLDAHGYILPGSRRRRRPPVRDKVSLSAPPRARGLATTAVAAGARARQIERAVAARGSPKTTGSSLLYPATKMRRCCSARSNSCITLASSAWVCRPRTRAATTAEPDLVHRLQASAHGLRILCKGLPLLRVRSSSPAICASRSSAAASATGVDADPHRPNHKEKLSASDTASSAFHQCCRAALMHRRFNQHHVCWPNRDRAGTGRRVEQSGKELSSLLWFTEAGWIMVIETPVPIEKPSQLAKAIAGRKAAPLRHLQHRSPTRRRRPVTIGSGGGGVVEGSPIARSMTPSIPPGIAMPPTESARAAATSARAMGSPGPAARRPAHVPLRRAYRRPLRRDQESAPCRSRTHHLRGSAAISSGRLQTPPVFPLVSLARVIAPLFEDLGGPAWRHPRNLSGSQLHGASALK